MRTRRLNILSLGWTILFFSQSLFADVAQWNFNGDLESDTGQAALTALAASPAVDPEVTFENVDIGGQSAEVAHFTQGTYLDVPHGFPPNGGGGYVNQYTLIMDVMFPDRSPSAGVTSLFQTNCCNQNDGDWFINPDGGLGVSGVFAGSVPDGEWHRIALVVDLVVGTMISYVDGVEVNETPGDGVDGRFSLYSPTDTDADPYESFFIFADESGENSEGFINSFQFHDMALSASVLAEIGGPSADGIPKDVCAFPAAVATRDLTTSRSPAETNGDFLPGDLIGVEITVSDIRAANPPCTAPAGVVIVETVPTGWTTSQISDGGSLDAGTNKITWTLTGATFTEGKKLEYKATAAATTELRVIFAGTLAENIAGAKTSPVGGEDALLSDVPYDDCGGIRSWNILGCYTLPAGNWPDGLPGAGDNPGVEHMRLDFLTDGDIFEPDFVWYPGAEIATAYGGDGLSGAASIGLQSGTMGANPNGVPRVIAWNDRDSFINLNDDVYGGDPNGAMAYLECYVNNPGPSRDVQIGVDSDDSILVLLNDEEVWANSVARGAGACEFSDKSPDLGNYPGPITLVSGENKLVLKVFEGGGGFNAQFRFEDPATSEPITDFGVSKTPTGVCLIPPLKATRDIDTTETVKLQHSELPRWRDGVTYDVSIAISDIRAASPDCAVPSNVKIEEIVPNGWLPSAPSGNGTVAGTSITWNLSGAEIANGVLTYQVKAAGAGGQVTFRGKVSEPSSPISSAVGGESSLQNPTTFTENCFISTWLLLGPYAQPGILGANPAEAQIRRDHLCDGASINELDVEPKAGDVVHTSYTPPAGGCARSTGLRAGATTPINPDNVPTWFAWQDADDTINFNDYYGTDLDNLMMYAVAYVDVAADVVVDIGLDSDDSVQVLLDGQEVWINSVARGQGGANFVADVVTAASVAALNPLTAGRHKLIVKVFDGTGDNVFRLRFQDPTSVEGVCDGISVCLNPTPGSCASTTPEICTGGVDEDGDGDIDCADSDCASAPECAGGALFVRGDSDGNGQLQLTDAIRILGVLFLGQGSIDCLDAADSDDNGSIQLTDAIRILGVLFLGQGTIPPPNACGADATQDGLEPGCASYPPCEG